MYLMYLQDVLDYAFNKNCITVQLKSPSFLPSQDSKALCVPVAHNALPLKEGVSHNTNKQQLRGTIRMIVKGTLGSCSTRSECTYSLHDMTLWMTLWICVNLFLSWNISSSVEDGCAMSIFCSVPQNTIHSKTCESAGWILIRFLLQVWKTVQWAV